MLEVLFTHDWEVEDLLCDISYGSDHGLSFSSYFFRFGFKPIQEDFQHDFV